MSLKSKIFWFLLLCPVLLSAQEEHIALSISNPDTVRPTYLRFNFGSSYLYYRDFATSPLFYQGIAPDFGFYRLKSDPSRESNMGFTIGYGEVTNHNNKENITATIGYLSIHHSELYQILRDMPETWNIKVGAHLTLTGNYRLNRSFNNNDVGVEGIGTLMASGKITRDISRKKSKTWDLKYLKWHFFPRKRTLSWQINTALINSSYRNGYAYMEHSSVQNDYDYFDEHELHIFSGYRLSSSLTYAIFLKNKNAIAISYHWDAYKTGKKDFEQLEMARHQLALSFLFGLNEPIQNKKDCDDALMR